MDITEDISIPFDFFVILKKTNVKGHEAIKLELIEWLTKPNDADTLDFLKIVKESHKDNQDWWLDLTNEQKNSIERGINDIRLGKVTSHSEIANKYGL